MKKISILAVALLTVGAASAQVQLVKDVEHQLKGDVASYPKAIETLKPAFTDEVSAGDAYTWFVAGKGAMDFVNNANAMQRVTGELNAPQCAGFVLDGFEYLQKALPLDTVVDAKGKVKTKYSKEIVKQIVNNYDLAQQAGMWYYNDVKDYGKAAEAWELLFTLPANPNFAKAGLKAYPDSTMGMFAFYQGCAYSLANDPVPALAAFEKAIGYGYDKKEAYDYAITSANQAKEYDKAAAIAARAYEIYQDNNYLGNMINNFLENQEYDKASALLDPYLQKDPNNAQVYYLMGVIADRKELSDEAKALYKKAVTLDSNNARARLQYAFKLCQEADEIDQNEGGNISNAEYKTFCETRTFPLYREAAENLEAAYAADETLTDCLTLLRSIYYKLGDEANLERIKTM